MSRGRGIKGKVTGFFAIVLVVTFGLLWALNQLPFDIPGLPTVEDVRETLIEQLPEDEKVLNKAYIDEYVIIISEENIEYNGEAVDMDELALALSAIEGETIVLIDKQAKHGKWTEVKDQIKKAGCVIIEKVE